ncbi:protein O-linked-mannose beta-1,2-N-acetylglucosaminyltransferase 1-like [Uloborus diversus]|uniref:protein O-linked-mannose beta-1,2-N-acetylglucosaminyltransferase 1-like n=1 Tax=Uloborus diversus TaxID=327109 RepID=UPI0024099CF0|nr:protein O-linked-mannose beta-1,2-N-acetylglucosaminyltransferase 1-like [Uloborus diversus]
MSTLATKLLAVLISRDPRRSSSLRIRGRVVKIHPSIQVGNIVPNCGRHKACDKNSFSVHIYTGKDHSDEPRLCIDGKYVLGKDLNEAGRGINVVVMDNMTKTVTRTGHFDTYERDSTPLETFLLTLRPGEIIFLLTFDESSRRMSRVARLLLYDLGSALIQSLSYRGSWYLITQKGTSGFSPFEDLHVVEKSGWPEHHDAKFCVPFEIKGRIVHPDPAPLHNKQRVEFCEINENVDFPLFCDADVVNDPLYPAPIWKQPSAISKIYDVPILVMSGSDIQYLPLTLETLIRQPGIKPGNVAVFRLEKNTIVSNLAELFGYTIETIYENQTYCDRVAEAFEIASAVFGDKKHFLLIGENAIMAPDFLYFMGQSLSIMNIDESIAAVSALNENGFRTVSGDPSLAYRVESFTSLAVLVKWNFITKSSCSNRSAIDPLYLSTKITGDVLVPDVSRVTLAAPMSGSHSDVSLTHLSYDRTITYEQNIPLRNPERLYLEDYERELQTMLMTAVPLEFDAVSLQQCMNNSGEFRQKLYENLPLFITNATNLSSQIFVVYFYEEKDSDTSTIRHLTKCFNLFHHPQYPVRGMFRHILRFMLKENQIMMVGSKSPFFHFKPPRTPVLMLDHQLRTLVNVFL